MSQWTGRQRCTVAPLQHDEWEHPQHAEMRVRLGKARKSLLTHSPFLVWYGNFWTRPVLLLALLLWNGLLQQLRARADVGFEERGLKSVSLHSKLQQPTWLLTEKGCTIGAAKHLVVDPGASDNFLEPQPLRTDVTGPALCQWLDAMLEFHLSQRSNWEEQHETKKKTVGGLLYPFRRLKLHFRKFPQFEVTFAARHMDIWHDDRYGRPQPWISGYFCYETHEGKEESYGVFSLSTPACFHLTGVNTDAEQKALVHLLLNPDPRLNRRMEQHERRTPHKVKGAIVGAVSGIVTGASMALDSDSSRLRALTGALINAHDLPRISLQIKDFWMRGKTCYIRNRFWVPEELGLILCQAILKRGVAAGPFSLWKAHRAESVHMSVVKLDLFSYPQARMTVLVTEGLVFSADSARVHTLAFDTDPGVIPEYVYAMRTARFFRVPLAAGQLISLGRLAVNVARHLDNR